MTPTEQSAFNAMLEALTGASNYLDNLGGVSTKYRRVLAAAKEVQAQPADSRIAALEAKCADYEAALRDTMQSLAWLSFGESRGYSDSLLTTQQALDQGKAAMAKHGGSA